MFGRTNIRPVKNGLNVALRYHATTEMLVTAGGRTNRDGYGPTGGSSSVTCRFGHSWPAVEWFSWPAGYPDSVDDLPGHQ